MYAKTGTHAMPPGHPHVPSPALLSGKSCDDIFTMLQWHEPLSATLQSRLSCRRAQRSDLLTVVVGCCATQEKDRAEKAKAAADKAKAKEKEQEKEKADSNDGKDVADKDTPMSNGNA